MPAENFAEQERLMQRLDRESQKQLERVRDVIREAGRPDVLAEMDQKLRENELGITGARSTWHSISDAQRRVLLLLGSGPASLQRVGRTYDVVSPLGSRAIGIRLVTARNLAARDLLEWTGGAFDPEAAGVITEHARFVLKHGRPATGEHFEGYRP